MVERLDKTCRLLIYCLAFMVAIVIWNGNTTAIEIKDFVVKISFILLLAAKLFNILFSDKIALNVNRHAIFVILYGLLISFAYILTARCSLNTKAIIPHISGIFLFFIVSHYFKKTNVMNIIYICVVSATICAGYGILQHFRIDWLQWEIPAVVSTFGNENYFAIYLILMIPLPGILTLQSKRKSSGIIWIVVMVVMIFALSVSNSRGAMVGFLLASFLSVTIFFFRNKQEILKNRKILIFFLLIIAFCITIFFLTPDAYKKNFKTLIRYQAYKERLSMYKAAIEVIKQRPLLGVGPGNFVVSYPDIKANKILTKNPNEVLNHVHNDFLEIWAEYGLLSLLAYIGVLISFYIRWINGLKNARTVNEQLIYVLFIWSITGYLIYSAVSVAARYMSSAFYFWLMLTIGYLYTGDRGQREIKLRLPNRLKKKKILSFVSAVLVIMTMMVFLLKTTGTFLSDVCLTKASIWSKRQNLTNSLNNLNIAVKFNNKSVEAYYQRGFVLFSMDRYDEAIRDYRWVNELAPGYINVNFNLASCYYRKGDWINAIKMADISSKRFPAYEPPILMIATCYYYLQNPETALRYINRLLDLNPMNKKAIELRDTIEGILKNR